LNEDECGGVKQFQLKKALTPIPILKDLAEKEPWNRKDVEDAILYLKGLQK
jgi:hypothetical protein